MKPAMLGSALGATALLAAVAILPRLADMTQARIPRMQDAASQKVIDTPVALPTRTLSCSDGQSRTIDESFNGTVTFALMQDCLTSGGPHLEWLREQRAGKRLSAGHFFIVFAPPADQRAASRMFSQVTTEPVCWDAAGTYWSAGLPGSTPLTATVRQGRITRTARQGG